ncbi:MOSC domain-containing protein [Rhodococcus sp. IC4_135]|uniref:MOSC domain-containing protein n=1 Tax=Rhodococcus sp. IC4_135 TaxID=2715537 RepID=UPI00141EA474|nr:MOSC domain-containing protein [Rhodococcus sp. IC4_135]
MSGQVVAVSVARPQWQEMYGRQVFSSIVRTASEGSVFFALGGPEGNETAVHTEEVYACSRETYDLWAHRLRVDRSSWLPCHWGENLMVEGMPSEEELHIGDRFRIGAVLLEVSSPRIPCFKLSWRLEQPEAFLHELIADGRMGCYFRVVKPGAITAGDQIHRTFHANSSITVAELTKLLHDPTNTDIDALSRVLATPGLGDQATTMVRQRISSLRDGHLTTRDRWIGWRSFVVDSIRKETVDVTSFNLSPATGGPVAGYRAGQFLTVRLPEDAGGLVRNWSISDFGSDNGSYRISIRRHPDGDASRWMHDQLTEGSTLEIRPPTGRFVLDRGSILRTVLISAGIGVTPLVAMLKAHAERGNEAPPVLWLHVARSRAEHAFADEVDVVMNTIRGATRRVFYSAPGVRDELGNHYDRSGRIGPDDIREVASEEYRLSLSGREVRLPGADSDFYICGPSAFEKFVRDELIRRGVNYEAINSELFVPDTRDTAGLVRPAEAAVRFLRSGRTVQWVRDDDLTLLELAESHGVHVDSSCRIGTCGTCEVQILGGSVVQINDRISDPGPGRVKLCSAQPSTGEIDLDI